MKKSILILEVLILIFLVGCANKAYYHTSSPTFESWRFWTGLILAIELVIGFILTAKISAETLGQAIGGVIGSVIVSFLFGYIIFAEWGIRIIEWFFASTIGTIIIVILNFVGGIFALFAGTAGIWTLNGFHWHSIPVAKFVILPALIGGIIQLVLISKTSD